jgi:hypothetical protein
MSNKNLEKYEEIDGKKYKFVFPTMGESTEADMEYSKGYTNALKAGLWPRVKMERHVAENSLWSDEDNKKLDDKNMEFQELVTKTFSAVKNEEKQKLREALAATKNELMSLIILKQSLFNNTAESKADEAKVLSLVPKCVLNEDGSKIWDSPESFQKEKNTGLAVELAHIFVSFISDLDNKLSQVDNLLSNNPEEAEEAVEEIVDSVPVKEEVKVEEVSPTPKKVEVKEEVTV